MNPAPSYRVKLDPVPEYGVHAVAMTHPADDPPRQFAEAVMGAAQGLLAGEMRVLYPPIWRILAEGRPASTEEIAVAAGRSREEVASVIAGTPEMELDDRGRVLGVAFTLVPTRHRAVLASGSGYLWCVPDALIVSRLLHEPVRVTSPCVAHPATGREVSLQVEPDGIRAVDPPEAVIAFVCGSVGSDVRQACCRHQNLFCSANAAQPWLARHPDAFTVPARDAGSVMAPLLAQLTPPAS